MNNRCGIVIVAVLVIFAVTPTFSPLLGTVEVALTAKVTESTLVAGRVGHVGIELINVGSADLVDVRAHLQVPATLTGIAILQGSYHVFDNVSASSSVSMQAEMAPSATLLQGAYSLSLNLVYGKEGSSPITDNLPIGILVNAPVSEIRFDATLDDYHVIAGSEQQLRVIIRNLGGADAYDLDATVASTNPQIAILKNATVHMNKVESGSSFDIEPIIGSGSSLPLGPITLGLSLQYHDASGFLSLSNLSIGLLVNSTVATPKPAVHVKQFNTAPTEIRPGDRFSLVANIENSGAEVTNLQALITIPPTTPFALSVPSLAYLGTLQEDQTTNVSYSLAVAGDAAARYYPLQLTITYYDNNDRPGTLTETVSVAIQSVQNFELVNISPFSLSAESGEEISFDADLLLVGTESARFVEIEVLTSEEFEPSSLGQKYIGFMDPDSPVPLSSGFIVKSTASEGEHILSLRVTYWDPHNTERQQVIQIPVTVSSTQSNQDTERGLTILDWLKILFGIRP